MRRLEERTEYGDSGLVDEWVPFTGSVDTFGWTDSDFRRFVREFNRDARAGGDWTRLRSVDVEDD